MISIYSKLNCKGNLCDSEYTDKMFLFLMLYFDGFYHEIDVKFYELILCILPTFFRIY